jgi:transcription elongation factor GreA
MASDRITLTRAGHERLERELRMLEDMRDKDTADVADAFDDTDFGDNAVFYDLVFDKDRLNARINNLRHVLSRADVIEVDEEPDKVSPGNRVTLWDFDEREELTFDIISAEEVTLGLHGISTESPVGRALLGHTIGEVVEIEVPDGTVRYAIRNIDMIPDEER